MNARPAHIARAWPAGVPHELPTDEHTLCDYVARAAAAHPDKCALVFADQSLTYGELHAQVLGLAAWLQRAAGVARGDRVLLLAPNGMHFVVAYYAILRAGGVVVPASTMSTADDVAWLVIDSGATVAIADTTLIERLDGVPGLAMGLAAGSARWAGAVASGKQPCGPPPVADDLALLPYTSGTTGRPKGCRHTHRTVTTSLRASAAWRGLHRDDVFFSAAPLFHLLGMQSGMNLPILLGATTVLMARWNVAAARRLVPAYGVSYWAAPPTMVIDFFGDAEVESLDLSRLRRLVGGGAAMPTAVAQRLRRLAGLTYNEAYGMTETASFLHCNPVGAEKPTCLGVPTFGVDSRIVDPETLVELPFGEEGELITHAAQLMLGYWNNPAADAAAFVEIDGKRFLRTGDLCVRDDDGYFFLRDRLKRMINAAGFKVWPTEVENALHAHPAVREACVIGSPDARAGEVVKALVVLDESARGALDEAGLIAWSRTVLAPYKAPRRVQFVERLPRSATGKVMWRELQALERETVKAQQGGDNA